MLNFIKLHNLSNSQTFSYCTVTRKPNFDACQIFPSHSSVFPPTIHFFTLFDIKWECSCYLTWEKITQNLIFSVIWFACLIQQHCLKKAQVKKSCFVQTLIVVEGSLSYTTLIKRREVQGMARIFPFSHCV